MDLYLIAKCRFFLCNSAGIMCVGRAFNTPLAPANYAPYAYVGVGGTDTYYIPKYLRDKKTGKRLHMQEIRDLGLLDHSNHALRDGSFYEAMGLEWEENTEDDILNLCLDMMAYTEGKLVSEEVGDIQDTYLSYYAGTINDTPDAGRIAPSFALRHADLVLPKSA